MRLGSVMAGVMLPLRRASVRLRFGIARRRSVAAAVGDGTAGPVC